MPDRAGPHPLGATLGVLERGMEAGLQTGGQVSLVLGDGRRFDAAAGQIAPGEQMTPAGLAPLHCAARPLLACAIAALGGRVGLRLDDRIASVLPEFATGGKEDATVRDLLLHTTGIHPDPLLGRHKLGWAESVAAACAAPARWKPGENAAYLQVSAWYLMVETLRRASGEAVGPYLRRTLLEPLGLASTWVGMPADAWQRHRGRLVHVGHVDAPDDLPLDLETEEICCAALPYSPRGTAADLATFYAALLDGEAVRGLLHGFEPGDLLHLARPGMVDRGWTGPGAVVDWALLGTVESRRHGRAGQIFGRFASDRTVGHFGHHVTVGFVDPQQRLAAAFCVNGLVGPVPRLLRTQAFCTALYRDAEKLRAE